MPTDHARGRPGLSVSEDPDPRAGPPPLQDRSPSRLCPHPRARSVRGTSLRIADLRFRPAYISLAASPPDPARRVGPTPPDHPRPHRHSRSSPPIQPAPRTVDVKDPRPLTRSASGRSLTPTADPAHPRTGGEPEEKDQLGPRPGRKVTLTSRSTSVERATASAGGNACSRTPTTVSCARLWVPLRPPCSWPTAVRRPPVQARLPPLRRPTARRPPTPAPRPHQHRLRWAAHS